MKISLSRKKESAYKPPLLSVDNPGGNWLRDEQEYNASRGKNRHGSPARFGATTAWWSRKVLIPVAVLKSLRGTSGEQDNVRHEDLAWLTDHMSKQKRLPLSENGKHYAPYVEVWQDGTAWVSEGNHRIMAAAASGFKYLPIELRYFGGAEQASKGVLSPDRVVAYDEKAFEEGYTLEKYAP